MCDLRIIATHTKWDNQYSYHMIYGIYCHRSNSHLPYIEADVYVTLSANMFPISVTTKIKSRLKMNFNGITKILLW